jgi:hypothetical protein
MKVTKRLVDVVCDPVMESISPYKSIFKNLFENDFRDDLNYIIMIALKEPDERSKGEKWLIRKFKKIYKPNGVCPSNYYRFAGSTLKKEYDELHKNICFLLYDGRYYRNKKVGSH